jgi:hypothetical protein
MGIIDSSIVIFSVATVEGVTEIVGLTDEVRNVLTIIHICIFV